MYLNSSWALEPLKKVHSCKVANYRGVRLRECRPIPSTSPKI
jgi:hypothetical protein